ncbi:hypothetical protein B0H66DRAFT_68995 [Apodospora peruviana]|uniref:Uncharacterized protein n=1 Tax=Apodospora peruviana TaxID=516989 RepID=A0AAE0ISR1_9PEZI|nr:hypothetical protein B0H66DRAFT_68995 [Apodospora peruviana]
MRFLAVFLALVATAVAVPTTPPPPVQTCKPATYACAKNPKTGVDGWQVCDVLNHWIYAGDCPPNTVCKFLVANGSPYCLPK